jgi:hypothetical protein
MSDTREKMFHTGRMLKFFGIAALTIQLLLIGVTEILAVLLRVLRLVENTWFWVFVAFIVAGTLLQKYFRPSGSGGAPAGQGSVSREAGRFTIEDIHDDPGSPGHML